VFASVNSASSSRLCFKAKNFTVDVVLCARQFDGQNKGKVTKTKTKDHNLQLRMGARGSVVGCGAVLQAGTSRVQIWMRSFNLFNIPNRSSHTIALV
jgi:hypothetical protein